MPKKSSKRSQQCPWARIEAGPDAIEIQRSNSWRGVNIRITSKDGEVSLKEEEVRRLIAEISAALD